MLRYQGPGAAKLALQLWERAAQQGNIEALLKLGDAHYGGRGTPRNWGRSAKVSLQLSASVCARRAVNLLTHAAWMPFQAESMQGCIRLHASLLRTTAVSPAKLSY